MTGLNVVETWNSANGFIFFGKGGELASNRLEDQELAALSLHLLQNCLVYVNTLMLQRIPSEPGWADRMTTGGLARPDAAALCPYQPLRPIRIRISNAGSTQLVAA